MKRAGFLCIVVVAALALSGCGPEPTPPPPPSSFTQPVTTSTFTAVTTPQANCVLDGFRVPLTMYPETADEARLIRSLDACTGATTAAFPNGRGIYLSNHDATAVWVLDKPTGLTNPAFESNLSLRNRTFRNMLRGLNFAGVTLEPQRYVYYPNLDPLSVHLYLDASAQAAWQVLNLTVESVQDKTRSTLEDAAVKVLGGSAPSSRQAAVTCAVAGFNSGTSITAARKGTKVDALQAAIQVGSSASVCGRALDAARAERLVGMAKEEVVLFQERSSTWRLGEFLFGLAETVMKLRRM